MSFTLHTGDTREILPTLPSESVQLVVTSPPYWKQRDYGIPFQMGDEPSPEEFTDALVTLFREVRRVLRADGLAFVNLGTTYIGGNAPAVGNWKETDAVPNAWLFGLAARADGWYLRSEVIWEKINPKPQSVDSRFALVHETVVVLAKSRGYFYDADAVREPYAAASIARRKYGDNTGDVGSRHGVHQRIGRNADGSREGRPDKVPSTYAPNMAGRLRKSVWRMRAPSFDDEHTASYPEELVRPMVLFGTSEAGACGVCATPIERVVQKGEPLRDVQRASGGDAKGEYHGTSRRDYSTKENERIEKPSDIKAQTLASMVERVTIGWKRVCSCDTTAVRPCVVLDPFGGTHTTGAVALDAGRDYVGVEGDAATNSRAEIRLARAGAQPRLDFTGAHS